MVAVEKDIFLVILFNQADVKAQVGHGKGGIFRTNGDLVAKYAQHRLDLPVCDRIIRIHECRQCGFIDFPFMHLEKMWRLGNFEEIGNRRNRLNTNHNRRSRKERRNRYE